MNKNKISKEKAVMAITIGIACLALMLVMFMQFKVVKQTDITSIENMREEELRSELANWRQMYKEAQEQYEEKNSKLEEYKAKQESTEESSKLIEEELERTNMYLGKTDVQGPGIEINIKNDSSEDADFTAEDLLTIVDYLKLAGAEAISVNDERIINTSDIAYISNSIIFVNQQRILAPYVIKAIGDSTKLESTLLGNGGYVELLNNIGFDVSINKKDKITIYKYNKEIGYKYIK